MRVAAVTATLAAAIVILGTQACKKPSDPASVEFWEAQLKDRHTRGDALKELGKLGKKEAVPVVLPWLEEEGPSQADAAFSLGMLGDTSVVPKLIEHIDYNAGTKNLSDPTVQNAVRTNMNIARALVMLKSHDAVAPLLKLLQNPEPKTREVVIRSLGQLHATEAVPKLIDLIQNERDLVLAQTAVRALGEAGDPSAAPTLTLFLFNDALYDEARLSLVQLGAGATPVLVKALSRQDSAVEALRLDGKPLPEGTIETRSGFVLGASRASDAEAALISAFERLSKAALAKPKDAPPSLTVAVIELAYALGNLGGAGAVRALVPLTRSSSDNFRVAAAEALTTAGPDPASISALTTAAQSGSIEARGAAIVALGRIAGGDILPTLQALPKKSATKDVPAEEIATVVEATMPRVQAAEACKNDLPCWKNKLRDPVAMVRERAAYALGWLGAKDSVAELMKAAEDDDALVRMAAVLSMHRLNVGDPAALQKLLDAWSSKVEYVAVNQELRWLTARRQHPGNKT